MLNSISGRNDFYSRNLGVESYYARNFSTQTAGLSAKSLDAINQLSGIGSLSSANLRLNAQPSLNQLTGDFLQKRTNSTSVSLSAPAKIQSGLSDFNRQLKTLVSETRRNPLQASSADENLIKAKALKGGDIGKDINVDVQQLAQGQISQTEVFSAASDLVGAGRLTIQLGAISNGVQQAEGAAVTIDLSATDTLSDVSRKIQTAQANVKSIVISDEQGTRLQLESQATGEKQAFTLQVQALDGGVATGNLAKLAVSASAAQNGSRIAQDARVQIDGRDIRSASNQFADGSANISLELRATGTSVVSFSRDSQALSQNIAQFATQYNQLRSQLSAVEAGSTRLSESAGLARRELGRLDQIVNNLSVGLGLDRSSLGDFGITTANDGRLIVNETRLSQQALAKPEAANNLLNRAVDQLVTSSENSLQDLAKLNSPFQTIQRNSSAASAPTSASSLSLLQSDSQSVSWRSTYGVSLYLQVAQFS